MFKIDKDVPIPSIKKEGKYSSVLRSLYVGDSFCVKGERNKIQTAVFATSKRIGIKVLTRTTGGGVRIWRVS